MSASKAKGTKAESALVSYLRTQGFPHVERRALSGVNDKGDVAGCHGLVFEMKNVKTYAIPAWLKETEIEKDNAGADFGVLVVKPNRIGLNSPEKFWAVMSLEDMVALLHAAGFGEPL